MIHIPHMLLIGSTGRNSGKTTLAAAFIHQWREHYPIFGLKITSTDRRAECPRGGQGCGACHSFASHFELLEETSKNSGKDTSVLLEAGCEKVYWLKSLKPHIGEGIRHFLTLMPGDSLIVCESNSLRTVANPGVFVMLDNTDKYDAKESSIGVMDKADIVIQGSLNGHIRRILDDIEIDRHINALTIRKRAVHMER